LFSAENKYILGDLPCSTDAVMYNLSLSLSSFTSETPFSNFGSFCSYAFLNGFLNTKHDSVGKQFIAQRPALVAYIERITGDYFPELLGKKY
jgi:hypothetical protein